MKIYITADDIISYIKNPNEEKLKQIQPLITSKAWRDDDISRMLQEFMGEAKVLNSKKLFSKIISDIGDWKMKYSILENNSVLNQKYIDWDHVQYKYIVVLNEISKINKILPNLKFGEAFPTGQSYPKLSSNEVENSIKKLKESSIKINFDDLSFPDKEAFFKEVQMINQLLDFSDTANKVVYETQISKDINNNEILSSDLLYDLDILNEDQPNNLLPFEYNLANSNANILALLTLLPGVALLFLFGYCCYYVYSNVEEDILQSPKEDNNEFDSNLIGDKEHQD